MPDKYHNDMSYPLEFLVILDDKTSAKSVYTTMIDIGVDKKTAYQIGSMLQNNHVTGRSITGLMVKHFVIDANNSYPNERFTYEHAIRQYLEHSYKLHVSDLAKQGTITTIISSVKKITERVVGRQVSKTSTKRSLGLDDKMWNSIISMIELKHRIKFTPYETNQCKQLTIANLGSKTWMAISNHEEKNMAN